MSKLANLQPPSDDLCAYALKALTLEPDDTQIMLNAAKEPKWSGHSLHKALAERGIRLAKDTVLNHMKGTCRCSKI